VKNSVKVFLSLLLISSQLTFAQPSGAATFNGLPNSKLTPGVSNPAVTQKNIGSTICVVGYTKTIRPPASYTTALKRKQLASGYNLNGDLSTADYEEDHLVPLEIGGHPSAVGNLWPEPRSGIFSAGLKDKLENKLHLFICAGKVTLAVAQAVFKTNWIAGYQKYIGALPGGAAVPSNTVQPTMSAANPTPAASATTPLASVTPSSALALIHPGSFCSPEGATGVNAAGTTYTCKSSATDTRNRWRQ